MAILNKTGGICQRYTYFYKRAQRNGLINPLPPYTECPSYGWVVPQGSTYVISPQNVVYIGATVLNAGRCGASYGCFLTPSEFCRLWAMRTQGGAGGTESHLMGMLARLMYVVPNIYCGTSPRSPLGAMARKGRVKGRGLSQSNMRARYGGGFRG